MGEEVKLIMLLHPYHFFHSLCYLVNYLTILFLANMQ